MVDVHFVPGMTADGIVADIRRVLDPLTTQDPDLRYAIEIPPPEFFTGRRRLIMDPLDVPVDTEIVRAWRAATRR
jgi:acetylornithine deacetylase